MITAPLKIFGGKHYLADRVISHMPPHLHYVEPYFGGGSVLLNKDPEGVSEVANDIYGELTNFWRVLQSDADLLRLKRRLEATPFSEREFNYEAYESISHIEDAAIFFVRCRQSRGGKMKSFATLSKNRVRRGMNEQVSAWLTAIEGLDAVHARLKRVVILNEDALKVIEREDSDNTLFYLDPPYLPETRVSQDVYQHEMDFSDHVLLLDCLDGLRGNVMLSGYRSPLYDSRLNLPAWHRLDFQIDNKASSAKIKPVMTECVWCNFVPQEST